VIRQQAVTLLGLLASVALLGAQAPQAPPPPTFQVSVNYVDVDVTVTDAQGRFVTGLTRSDFQLLEDGKPQNIDTFSYVELPVEPQDRFLALGRPVRSDVRSNRHTSAGRVYMIVLDDLDVSPLRTAQVRKTAREFVERHFAANDVAAVVCTSGRADVAQEFTSDPVLLLAAIDKFIGQRLRSAEEERIDAYYQSQILSGNSADQTQSGSSSVSVSDVLAHGQSFDPSNLERGQRAVGVLSTMRSLSEFLTSVRGRRKALLLFSEGIDYPMADVFDSPSGNEIARATQDALNAAAHANVNFFTIDPRGLMGLTTDFIETTRSGPPDYAGTDPTKPTGTPNTGVQALMGEMRLTQDSLRTLADGTGGFAAVDTNSFADAFDRIVQANSRYYLLGYNPPSHPRDGRFHRIEVTVKRPGLKVAARKGYPSPSGKTVTEKKTEGGADRTSRELLEALNSPMQQPGLALAVQAAAFKQSATEASVALAIELGGEPLQFAPQKNSSLLSNALEISFFPVNQQGKPQRGSRLALNLALLPETYQRVKALGVRANPRLSLAPGRYQLRIGARDPIGGQVGSVFYDLTVPDFTRDPLMISGLLLSSVSAQQVVTPLRDQMADKLLPAPATSRREFAQTDTLALLAEIYDNIPSRQLRQVDMAVRLITEGGLEVFASRDSLVNGGTESTRNWNGFDYTRQIPLKDVAPGRYLLRVEAQVRGNVGDAKPVAAETVITVTPAI
jgi:VWFA-related protein